MNLVDNHWAKKKVILFSEIGLVKKFLPPTCLHKSTLYENMGSNYRTVIREILCIAHFSQYSFSTYPENHDTKDSFCFLNRGTKAQFFLAKVKNSFNMMRISFLLKHLCCSYLSIRFFSLILIGVSFCNSLQWYVVFLSVHYFTIVERCFKSMYYWELHCCIPPNIKQRSSLIVFFIYFFSLLLRSIYHFGNSW